MTRFVCLKCGREFDRERLMVSSAKCLKCGSGKWVVRSTHPLAQRGKR